MQATITAYSRPEIAEPNGLTLAEENAGLRHDVAARNSVIARKDREISHLRLALSQERRRMRVCEESWKYEKMNAQTAQKKLRRYEQIKIACAVMAVALTVQFVLLFFMWTWRWWL